MSDLLRAILAQAAPYPERIALDDGRERVTYGAIEARVAAAAAAIRRSLGGQIGPVGIKLDNGIDWVIADLALMQEGMACLPLPAFFTEQQVEAALADAGAVAVITGDGIEHFPAVARDVPRGTAKITYTSGSTGDPKGICLSEHMMHATAAAIVDRFGAGVAGIHLPLLPLPVLLENVAGLYGSLLAGGTYAPRVADALGLASPFRPDFPAMIDAIERCSATSLIVVPQLLAGLAGTLAATGRRLPRVTLVAVGGARVSAALLEQSHSVGLPVVQGYGLTECGSVVTIEEIGETGRGTTGRALGHVRVTLAADGEIIVVGAAHLGSVGVPRETGPIATGDIGTIDDAGRLSIVGRKSSLLITGFGRNIAPEWPEECLCAQPAIAQAFVHGDGAASLSAIIVPRNAGADLADAVATANAMLPVYARIETWRSTVPFSPMDNTLTPNGRLRRDAIMTRETLMPFFNRLVEQTMLARNRMLSVPQIQAGLAGAIDRETYLAYLAQAYHHVRHTVPLMRKARERLDRSPMLVAALDEYIVEEMGHEQWVLEDITAAGGDVAKAIADGPSTATAAMVDHAYDVIQSGNAAAFFGMVFVLEGTSTALATRGAEAVRTRLALPPEAFRYLTSHGSIDVEHMVFFENLMNRITDPADQAAIVSMANSIFALFGGMFAAIPFEPIDVAA